MKKTLLFLPAFLAVIFAGSTFYFFQEMKDLKENQAAVGSATDEEVDALVLEVGNLIVLPKDERPSVATISDPETLRDQPFFANAQKGDKVLIYTRAGKAILYDPKAKKIVEVAPVNLEGQEEQNVETNTQAQAKETDSTLAEEGN